MVVDVRLMLGKENCRNACWFAEMQFVWDISHQLKSTSDIKQSLHSFRNIPFHFSQDVQGIYKVRYNGSYGFLPGFNVFRESEDGNFQTIRGP